MSIKKTATIENPHATFNGVGVAGGWEYKVLKVYRGAKTDKGDQYARWLMAVKSPATFGEYDVGDTYINDVLGNSTFQSGTDEFQEYYKQII